MGVGASGMRGRGPDAPAAGGGAPSGATPADRSRANDTPPSEHRGGRNGRPPADPNSFDFAVWQIKDGEDKLIADRLVEIFSQTPKV